MIVLKSGNGGGSDLTEVEGKPLATALHVSPRRDRVDVLKHCLPSLLSAYTRPTSGW